MRPNPTALHHQCSQRQRHLALLLATVFQIAGCGAGHDDPNAAIHEWLAAAEVEAEERDRRALMARISDSYADARGNQRGDIEDILRYLFLRQQSVSILTTVDELRVFGDTAAEVRLTVGMAGSSGGLNLSADLWKFELDRERRDEDWLLIGARWGEAGGEVR